MNPVLARRAWDRWQAAAGPWQGWTICPALLHANALDRHADAPNRHAKALDRHVDAPNRHVGGKTLSGKRFPDEGRAENVYLKTLTVDIGRLLEPGATLCVIDLEPELGVELAADLSDIAHPVLLLPRWPYANAVLPVDRLLSILLDASHRLPRQPPRHDNVVFVLDNQRARPVPARSPTDPRADNRYHVATFDLPDLRTLRQRGIRRIQRISRRAA